MENVILKFDSVTSFDNYINNRPTQKNWVGQREESLESGEEAKRFRGTESFEEAEALLIHGDKENYDKLLKRAITKIAPRYRAQKQLYSSVVGCAPNVAAFVAGAPNAMIAQKTINVKRKVVNIVFNATWHGGQKVDDIIDASLEVLRKVVSLEASGTRVNLYTATLSDMRRNGHAFGYIVKIKDARQAMDILKMTYPMVNASMLRRQGFRFWETTEGVPYDWGYGQIASDGKVINEALKNVGLREFVYVDGQKVIDKTKEEAEAYLKSLF
jgi:hypothetical protein